MAEKKITIDDLASMVQRGFTEQSKIIREGFADQDRRIDAKFVAQDERIDAKFVTQDGRIDAKFVAQDQKIVGLGQKIDSLRTEMHNGFRRLHEDMNEIKIRLTNLEERTLADEGLLSQEFLHLKQKVTKLEKRLIELETAR